MPRVNYVPLNQNDNLRDFASEGKIIGSSYETSQVIQVNEDFNDLALDFDIQEVTGSTFISFILEHSLLGGASYWAPGVEADNFQVIDDSEVQYDAKRVRYNIKNISAGLARRFTFKVSNSVYIRVRVKTDAGTAKVRVLASIAD